MLEHYDVFSLAGLMFLWVFITSSEIKERLLGPSPHCISEKRWQINDNGRPFLAINAAHRDIHNSSTNAWTIGACEMNDQLTTLYKGIDRVLKESLSGGHWCLVSAGNDTFKAHLSLGETVNYPRDSCLSVGSYFPTHNL